MVADRMHARDIWLAVLASVVVAAALWFGVARPRVLDHEWQGPLKSASFAPFRNGQSPLHNVFPTAAEIEDDLVRLKGMFEGVRTYTVQDGMEVMPDLADKHGFKLTHGAWLGRDAAKNENEIAALIEAADRHPQSIERIIVGNEVLLRGDLESEVLIGHIDRVRSAVQQPVSYADVWAFWLKYPQVADHVDFITIHILPYWEDEPVSVVDAQAHLLANIERIRQRFPGKPILVGETGWPTEGRSRGPAHANTLTAAHFVRDLPALAAKHNFDYNLVEAYDQSWKAHLEGTVGARWGLFDAQRQQKYALVGTVSPLPNALMRALSALVVGVVLAIALVPLARTRRMAIVLAFCTQLIGAGLVESVYHAVRLTVSPTSFTWMQQHLLFYAFDAGWLSQATLDTLYKPLLQDAVGPLALVWGWMIALFAIVFTLVCVRWTGSVLMGTKAETAARLARSGFGIYGLSVLVFALMFARAGRYIDIPVPHMLLPLGVVVMLCSIARWQPRVDTARCAVYTRCHLFNRYAVWLLCASALFCLWGEAGAMMGGADFIAMHPTRDAQVKLIAGSIMANTALLLWCAASVVLGVVFARGWRARPVTGEG